MDISVFQPSPMCYNSDIRNDAISTLSGRVSHDLPLFYRGKLRNCHVIQGHRSGSPVLMTLEILYKKKGGIIYVHVIKIFHANVH